MPAASSPQNASWSFALASACPDAVDAHLYVEGLGSVGMPVSAHDACAIIQHCHEAAYGQGGELVVDAAVRKTSELNASEFELRNPAWQVLLKELVDEVALGLGVSTSADAIEPKLHKLLVYDKGAMFKLH